MAIKVFSSFEQNVGAT